MKILSLIAAILISTSITFAANEKAPAAPTTKISGQVVDNFTGEALAGVKIELNETTIYTDFDGNFEFSNVVPGDYKINSSLISYNPVTVDIDCKAEKQEIEIKLSNK